MTAPSVVAADGPIGPVLEQVLERAADPKQWERLERQMRSTGYCRRPVRLRGQVDAVDVATGECRTVYSTEPEPDSSLLKCCGNRREAVCPSCAETYRGDAYQLVAAGLRGGKGVPESVTDHPTIFVTLTAPSFGAVHSRRLRNDRPQRCRPRRRAEVCPHGRRLSCGEVHAEDDPRLGEPLCAECFDYDRAVIWNALAPELWRRTAIQIPRELARLAGVSHRELRRRVRVSYVKVAEYQRRGSLHFHCVIRLDRAQPRDSAALVQAPDPAFSRHLLCEAVRAAAGRVSVPAPGVRRDVDGRRDPVGARARDAAPRGGRRRGVEVRRIHRQVRNEVDRGRRRAHQPPRARATSPGCGYAITCAATSSARGGSAATPTCATCGCAGGRTRWDSEGTASPRAGATPRPSPRCGAHATNTRCVERIRRVVVIRGAGRSATVPAGNGRASRWSGSATARRATRGWPSAPRREPASERQVAREELHAARLAELQSNGP